MTLSAHAPETTSGPRRTATRWRSLGHALSVSGVFVAGIILAGWAARELDVRGLLYLFIVPAYVTVVLTHEFGHALAGLMSDFRVAFLYMGPLRVEWPKHGSVIFGLNRRLSLWGGAVVVLPRSYPAGSNLEPFRKSMTVMFAAGPGASLVAGVVALALSLAFPPLQGPSFGSALSWLQLLAFMSIVVGLGQVFPIRLGDQLSDGFRVLRLVRGRPGTNNALLDAMIVANADGVRPRDWPLPRTRAFEEITDLPTLLLIFYALMDRGDVDEAWRVLNLPSERREGKSDKVWRVVRDLEFAYLRTAYFKEDGAELPAAAIDTKHPRIPAMSLLRARTARMVAHGELQEAMRSADTVRHLRSVPRTSGLTQFNLSELDNVLASAAPGTAIRTGLTA